MIKNEIITIFGASGFIGRNVVRLLAQEGYRIRAACRDLEKAKFLRTMGEVGQISIIQAFVENEASVDEAIKGANMVINLVGTLYEKRSQTFEQVHIIGAQTIAKATAAQKVQRLIHFSALGASKQSPSRYAQTKKAGEKAVMEAYPRAIIVRPSVVFGPDDLFYNRFARLLKTLPILPLIGSGSTELQPVYVGDVAHAIREILQKCPNRKSEIFEIGGPRIYTFRRIIEYMVELTHSHAVLLPIPFPLAKLMGRVCEWLPNPPLTYDQVLLLQCNNTLNGKSNALLNFGITPQPVEAIVPSYIGGPRAHN